MKNLNNFKLTAFALITVGVIIRLININQPLLEFFPQRQTQTAEITRNIYKNGWPDFWTPKVRYFTDGKPIPYVLEFPLYNGIVSVAYHLFGPNVIWGRLLSILFFTLSSIIFFRIISLKLSRNESLAALLAYSLSPIGILTSRSFQPDALLLFLFLSSIYYRSFALFALAALIKVPIVLFAPVLLFSENHRRNVFKMIIALIPTIGWSLYGKRVTDSSLSIAFDLNNWFRPKYFLTPGWYASVFTIEHIWVLTSLGLLFAIIGLVIILSKHIRLFLVWLFCCAGYIVIFNHHMATHEYYHLLILPLAATLTGIGMVHILRSFTSIHHRQLRYILICGVIIMYTAGLLIPAMKKIIKAPTDPEQQSEVSPERYHLLE